MGYWPSANRFKFSNCLRIMIKSPHGRNGRMIVLSTTADTGTPALRVTCSTCPGNQQVTHTNIAEERPDAGRWFQSYCQMFAQLEIDKSEDGHYVLTNLKLI